MTREEFNKILQDEIEKNRNNFANALSAREDKKMTVEVTTIAEGFSILITLQFSCLYFQSAIWLL